MGEKKKAGAMLVRLVSAAGTGFFYVVKKTKRLQSNNIKLEFRKYDPRLDATYYDELDRIFDEIKLRATQRSNLLTISALLLPKFFLSHKYLCSATPLKQHHDDMAAPGI
ncbi:50S ribosomal protein L33 [Striga asiatica]|uniref:50S ribosomal protein L33 n=1 Tax=Striga asiatica TaxID=4170 RepID=A0A5A7QIF1_STRAF|nr:50S ribosomal protein L33 [Striga asiatica]